MKPIQGEVFTTVDNTNDIVRVMEVKEAVRRIREHNKIHQSAEPRNSPIITEILESCARLLEDIDAGKVRYVEYGEWIDTHELLQGAYYSYQIFRCSECNEDSLENGTWCPNCGAKMKEE